MYKTVGIVGLGCVGGAMKASFEKKNITVIGYDKYKEGGIGTLESCLKCDVIFLCLPTLFNKTEYDKYPIVETCEYLDEHEYKGLVVLKSTVEPGTTAYLSRRYGFSMAHNPEFLTARTAYEDFHNQKHIVLGMTPRCDIDKLISFYKYHYPEAKISVCTATESESMKIFVNSFYASKIQIFNEYYLLCQKLGISYDKVRSLMLENKWINPMHTIVPGPDGKLSYGGMCFPKDTNALYNYMKRQDVPHAVLESVIKERNSMRDDHIL